MEFSVQQQFLPAVVIVTMVTIGMELHIRQFRELLAAPRVPVLGTLVHTLAFPLLAVGLVLGLRASGLPVAESTVVGILLIAACPSGGFSNVLTMMARANLALSVTLTVISSALSFLSVPLLMGAFAGLIVGLDEPIALPVLPTLVQLLVLILLPISAGMGIRARWGHWTELNVGRIQNAAQIALYICIALIVVENWGVMVDGARDALPWSLLLCAANLAVCFGASRALGLGVEDGITVAMEGAIRNLAVALLVAVSILERPDIAALPTVYFVAVLIVAVLFARNWRRLLGAPG